MVVDRGVLKGGPMKVFREGISLVINFWWQIRRFVKHKRADYRELDQLRHCLFDWFIQSKGEIKSIHNYIFYFTIKINMIYILFLY
jgi:hypothetical protein